MDEVPPVPGGFMHPYAKMVMAEMVKTCPEGDLERAEMYFSLVKFACGEHTPFTASQALILATLLGLTAPHWAATVLDRTINDRIEGRIKTLDVAFGFTETGRGGAKKSEIYKKLLEVRNQDLALMMWQLTLLGVSEEDASGLVAEHLQTNTGWNKTDFKIAFDLSSTKTDADSRQWDELDKRERVASTLLKCYAAWRKQNAWINRPEEIERWRRGAQKNTLLQSILNQSQEK